MQFRALNRLQKEDPTRYPPSAALHTIKTAWHTWAHGRERNCCELIKGSMREYQESQQESRRKLAGGRSGRRLPAVEEQPDATAATAEAPASESFGPSGKALRKMKTWGGSLASITLTPRQMASVVRRAGLEGSDGDDLERA